MNRKPALLLFALGCIALLPCQAAHPLIGAEVWFAPDEYNQPEQIDRLFRTMVEHHMPVARVLLIWNHIERKPGQWDFSLYDRVFAAAEKHGIKIVATLWAQAKGKSLYLPSDTEEHWKAGEDYLTRVVGRYRNSRALDTWLLMNEPGQAPEDFPFAVQRFRAWLQKKYGSIDALNQAWVGDPPYPDRPPYRSFDDIAYDPSWVGRAFWPVPGLDWLAFWRDHLTWYLNWIARTVRRIDPHHPLHTNAMVASSNLASKVVDLPAWRAFLDTLGSSVYPSQLSLFGPRRYLLGLSYTVDVVRGAIEPKPAWITEMAGGNATYSTRAYPEPKEISQWLWTGIGGGAERMIFWLLSARWRSRETGEFGLLDYLGQPSERLLAASSVARTIDANPAFFDAAKPVESPFVLILSMETMALEERRKLPPDPVRDSSAHVRCAIGFYQALQELGIPARIKFMHDFDWRARTLRPRMAILPHANAMTAAQAADVETFVRNGNTVLASGMSGFYSPTGMFWPMEKEFPLERVFGARPREVRNVDSESAVVRLGNPPLALPSVAWATEIANRGAEVIGRQGEWVTAVRHKHGTGEAIWIPSPIGVGAFQGDGGPLARLLASVAGPFTGQLPFRFAGYHPGCLMRTLQNGGSYVSVVANATRAQRRIRVEAPAGLTPKLLWGKEGSVEGREVAVPAGDTVVALWQ